MLIKKIDIDTGDSFVGKITPPEIEVGNLLSDGKVLTANADGTVSFEDLPTATLTGNQNILNFYKRYTITKAQLLDLHNNPIILIEGQGNTKITFINRITLKPTTSIFSYESTVQFYSDTFLLKRLYLNSYFEIYKAMELTSLDWGTDINYPQNNAILINTNSAISDMNGNSGGLDIFIEYSIYDTSINQYVTNTIQDMLPQGLIDSDILIWDDTDSLWKPEQMNLSTGLPSGWLGTPLVHGSTNWEVFPYIFLVPGLFKYDDSDNSNSTEFRLVNSAVDGRSTVKLDGQIEAFFHFAINRTTKWILATTNNDGDFSFYDSDFVKQFAIKNTGQFFSKFLMGTNERILATDSNGNIKVATNQPFSLPISESNVTNLVTDLAGKSSTSHNHALNNLTEKSYNSLTDKPTIPTFPTTTDNQTLYSENGVLTATNQIKVHVTDGTITDKILISTNKFEVDSSSNSNDKFIKADLTSNNLRLRIFDTLVYACRNKIANEDIVSFCDEISVLSDGNTATTSITSLAHDAGGDLQVVADEVGKLKLANLSYTRFTITANTNIDLTTPRVYLSGSASYDITLSSSSAIDGSSYIIKNINAITDLSVIYNIKYSGTTIYQLTSQSTVELIWDSTTFINRSYNHANLVEAGHVKIASQTQFDDGTITDSGNYLMPTIPQIKSLVHNPSLFLVRGDNADVTILTTLTDCITLTSIPAGTYLLKSTLYVEFNTDVTTMNICLTPNVTNAISFVRGSLKNTVVASGYSLTNNVFDGGSSDWGGLNLLTGTELYRATGTNQHQKWELEAWLTISDTTNIAIKIRTTNGTGLNKCKKNSFAVIQKMN